MNPHRPSHRQRIHHLFCQFTFATLAALPLLCACESLPPPAQTAPQPIDPTAEPAEPGGRRMPRQQLRPGDAAMGLQYRVSEADPKAADQPPSPKAVTTPLPAAETAKLLQRLPKLAQQPADAQPFAMREKSLPAPRPGETVPVPFPPPPQPLGADATPTAPAGPLQVLRYGPQGDVLVAPRISLTFSQPMVPVTDHASLSKLPIPAVVTPAIEGEWRWIGTQTLVLQPKNRLPMATEYTVTVPAGTQAQSGAVLGQALTFSFRTPPPRIQEMSPQGNNLPLLPEIFVLFDQAIDPQQILARATFKAGGKAFAVRQLTVHDLSGRPGWKERMAQLQANGQGKRWLAVVPEAELPKNSQVHISWGPGLPSAEGPRVTKDAVSQLFRTYGPLVLEDARCGWDDECPPLHPWTLRFSNPLAAAKFDPKSITVEPAVPNLQVVVHGSVVTLSGLTRGRTNYVVKIPANLQDVYGQTLGKDQIAKFATTRAEPAVMTQGGALIVLDPASVKPQLAVWTVNHKHLKVKLWRVQPGQWQAWREAQRKASDQEKQPIPPGVPMVDRLLPLANEPDSVVESAIDLSPALQGQLGHVLVYVAPAVQPKDRWRQTHFWAWVQVTRLGVTAVRDDQQLLGWASELATGKPAAGAELQLLDGKGKVELTAAVDGQGTAMLQLVDKPTEPKVLVARRGADVAMVPERLDYWSDSSDWLRREPGSSVAWHVVDDRGLYKPGETAHLKGWLRTVGHGPKGDLQGFSGPARVFWRLRDARGNDVGKGSVPLAPGGSFDATIALPGNLHLGSAQVILAFGEGSHDYSHSLRVEEFRRPEFESTTGADPGPYYLGDHALVTTQARYYAGGALPGAEVHWQLSAQAGHFEPPNCDGYSFGRQLPWWMRGWCGESRSGGSGKSLQSRLSSAGDHTVRLDFDSGDPPQPWAIQANATVFDVNRQAWSSQAALLVHPSAAYVGLKQERTFVEAGQPLDLSVIAADIHGQRLVGAQVSVRMFRKVSEQVAGEWQQLEKDEQNCDWTSTAAPGQCSFAPKSGGLWQVEATVRDHKGRENQTLLQVYVSGKDDVPDRSAPQDQTRLVPDRQEYAPGQTAELLVIAPWPHAEGELTLAREGRIEHKRFTIDGLTTKLQVPIVDGYTPGLHAHVALVGQAPRLGADGRPDAKLPPRPAHSSAQVYLAVPPHHRTLQVKVTPQDPTAAPGQKTKLNLQVVDAQGKPASGAEVLVVMADESVLALTGYRIASPMQQFYPQRGTGIVLHELRQWLLLAALPQLPGGGLGLAGSGRGGGGKDGAMRMKSARKSMAMDDSGGMPEAAEPMAAPPAPSEEKERESDAPSTGSQPAIAVRKDFNPLAVFAPAVTADASGKATVEVTLPDNLTRYRVMAVAAQGAQQFGSGEATVVARLPLMVRPSAPRFANFGDHFELPVVLQNQTDAPLEVRLAARSTVLKVSGLGLKFTVPPQDRVEVRLPTDAPSPGTGRVQLAVSAGSFSDAAEISLPVWTPATTEGFATYGVLDNGVRAQGIRAPAAVVRGFGGLKVTTSSTALQGLTDALLYLVRYPFECSEQRASRILAIAALRDVLRAFGSAELPSDAALRASMTADFKALERIQNHDGGYGFWRRGEESWPVTSLHVAHALVRAKQKGYDVPEAMLKRVLNYCESIDRHIPRYYGQVSRWVLRSEALYVRLQAGQRDVSKAKAIFAEAKKVESLPLEAIAWLWPVLSGQPGQDALLKDIRTLVNNRVEEQAGAAHFTVRYEDGAHLLLASDRRADALLLDALMTDAPDSDLIPKLVTGLLAHRKAGKWGSTQENSWVLLALDRYFRTYEKATPDFVARLWLGEQYAGEQAFKGRSTDRRELKVPMATLLDGPRDSNLLIQKEGPGRLYYRIGLDYAPADLKLQAMDRGFFVQRTYKALDKPTDVRRDPDGTWRIRAGARVQVRVEMVAQARRYHVALVDPLPAGFEAINGDLLGAQPPPNTEPTPEGSSPWRWGRWYEHDNLRDERAEAFTSLLWEGDWEYTYTCRATTPGTFAVPPAKAEEMYSPEVFGRSASDRVVVED